VQAINDVYGKNSMELSPQNPPKCVVWGEHTRNDGSPAGAA